MKNAISSLSLIVAGFLCVSFPAAADDFSVYVGYADNLRPSGFFPTPWIGDPNVVSQTPGNLSFDSGAVRIDNTSSSAITITDLTVTLDPGLTPVVFSIWSPLIIGAGQVGIFTETSSYNFDTSDYGFLGGAPNIDATHPLGGCTNPADATQAALCAANAPIVSFDANGTPTTLTDSGQVIDTFGYDFINGSSDGNESINWNAIGTGVTRGGTPEPGTVILLSSGLLLLAANRKRLLKR